MTQLDFTVQPGPLAAAYDEGYQRFVEALVTKGYYTEGTTEVMVR